MSNIDFQGDMQRKYLIKAVYVYMAASAFCVIFAGVYEHFSHGVYSLYMILAFLYPLIGGLVLMGVEIVSHGKRIPRRLSFNLYNSGIATLTVGSIFNGALEIYGTTNRLVTVYRIAGRTFLFAGIICYIVENSKKKIKSCAP